MLGMSTSTRGMFYEQWLTKSRLYSRLFGHPFAEIVWSLCRMLVDNTTIPSSLTYVRLLSMHQRIFLHKDITLSLTAYIRHGRRWRRRNAALVWLRIRCAARRLLGST